MSILRFIHQKSDFDDETVRVMGEAFDSACAERNDPSEIVHELIALRIIDAAKKGQRDPELLKRAALIKFER